MKNSRKKFLHRFGSGLTLAGLPSLASSTEKQTENKTNIDPADFTGEGVLDDKNSSHLGLWR